MRKKSPSSSISNMGISQDEVLELLRVKAWERAGEILGEDVDDGFDLVFPEQRAHALCAELRVESGGPAQKVSGLKRPRPIRN
jgi:hypothetical protein